MDLLGVTPPVLWATGLAVAAGTYINRDKPDWQKSMPALYALAGGQLLLGAVAYVLLALRPN